VENLSNNEENRKPGRASIIQSFSKPLLRKRMEGGNGCHTNNLAKIEKPKNGSGGKGERFLPIPKVVSPVGGSIRSPKSPGPPVQKTQWGGGFENDLTPTIAPSNFSTDQVVEAAAKARESF